MVGEDGHAEVDQLWPTVGPSPAEAVELGGGGVEADLESFDFSEPAVAAGLADAVAEVLDDLDDAATLAGVDLEDRAADAGFSELRARHGSWDGVQRCQRNAASLQGWQWKR